MLPTPRTKTLHHWCIQPSCRTLSAGGLCQQVSDSSSGRWMAVFTDQPGVTWSKTGKGSATPWLAAKHLLLQKHWVDIKIKKSFKSGFHTIFQIHKVSGPVPPCRNRAQLLPQKVRVRVLQVQFYTGNYLNGFAGLISARSEKGILCIEVG